MNIVFSFFFFATSSAFMTFGELPLVLIAKTISPSTRKRFQLSREDLRKVIVVGYRGDHCHVGVERYGGQTGTFSLETVYEFSGNMRRVRRTSAVAE